MMNKKYILFDLDGTLCNIEHRLHFIKDGKRDWDNFFKHCVYDDPVWPIIHVFNAVKNYYPRDKYEICIVTGRSDIVRDQTVDWLRQFNIKPDLLFMREEGDHTPDMDLKEEWGRDVFGFDNIEVVMDDRRRVVDMWRKNGVKCLQVEDGNF